MNYIQHLSAFYRRLNSDKLCTPHHISLYMAIFQVWNAARFENPFRVSREELMNLSKIGSVNTYTRCMKELHLWNLICYEPSRNINVGSFIRMITFDNTPETRVRHYIKQYKTSINISLKEIEKFFADENFDLGEAARFFHHYEANGWMMGNTPIQNWQAAAINWMAKVTKFQTGSFRAAAGKQTAMLKPGNLHTSTNKTYHEPL